MYTDVVIQRDSFVIVEGNEKRVEEGFALETLKQIELVIRRGLPCSTEAFRALPQDALRKHLEAQALKIRDKFVAKTFALARGAGKDVQTVYERIRNLVYPPRVLKLFNPVIQAIYRGLELREIAQIACLNRHGQEMTKQAFLHRARLYGYQGDFSNEALSYIRSLYDAIAELNSHRLSQEMARSFVRNADGRVNFERTLIQSKRAPETFRFILMCSFNSNHLWIEKARRSEEAVLRHMQSLFAAGVDIEYPQQGNRCLLDAVDCGYSRVLSLLLQNKADANAKFNQGSLLDETIRSLWCPNKIECVRILLAAKADPNPKTREGGGGKGRRGVWRRTKVIPPALVAAIDTRSSEIASLLIGAKADVNVKVDWGGRTLLLNAIAQKEEPIARLLLEANANPTQPSSLNRAETPLALAQAHGLDNIVKLLRERGAK